MRKPAAASGLVVTMSSADPPTIESPAVGLKTFDGLPDMYEIDDRDARRQDESGRS